MRTPMALKLLALGLLFPALARPQPLNDAGPVMTEAEKPYEVVIKGKPTRSRLRDLIVEVENDFFQRFNELNEDDYYDVHCYMYTPTMSHIKERVCEPAFMLEARSGNASEVAYGLGSKGKDAANQSQFMTYLESPQSLKTTMQGSYENLQALLEEFLGTDKEFAEIGSVLGQLKYQLQNYGK